VHAGFHEFTHAILLLATPTVWQFSYLAGILYHNRSSYPWLEKLVMKLSHCCFLACMLGTLAPAAAGAAEFNMDVKTEGVRLGKPITGPAVSDDDLKGRVVMIEFWGIN
jgi:hypothetical protein